MVFKVNDILKEYFLSLNVKLVDFKLEFGRLKDLVQLFWLMKYHLIPAAFGTPTQTKSLIKTVSAAIWAE